MGLTPTTILTTPRLTLHLNDPTSPADTDSIIKIYNDPDASLGGNARVGINTPEDVRAKHIAHGPRQEFCTLAPAPKGLYHLVYLNEADAAIGAEKGELLGFISMSFRREMPYPDLGYGFFRRVWGRGFGSEAGKRALEWWMEEVGVKEIWTGALPKNLKSQRCAENIGFVRCGEFDLCFGAPGEESSKITCPAFVYPGTKWREVDEKGNRPCINATVGVESEKQKNDPLNVG